MATKVTSSLPIDEHLEPLLRLLDSSTTLILQAPPGTGKTTMFPLALLDAPWMAGKRCLMLQPRRLAAKSVATRMAQLLKETVGRTVGYQMRLERVASAATRIEIITEGILAKRLISDPELSDVGAIIFDEFHERSIHADIGLALAREVAQTIRPDLRIIVMSATLTDPVSLQSLTGAARYEFAARTFPVQISYLPQETRTPLWERVAQATQAALRQHPGDVLVFLPGVYEIQRTESLLLQSKGSDTEILTLYGELSPREQERALAPELSGRRKVVLSTPIAETSVTIEGVRVIIDSGLHKIARSDAPGSRTLKTERITRDSSDQRAGRAGRTAPGVCIRLWSEQEHLALRPFREPEVMRTDLAPALLDLAAWGVTRPEEFQWITPPPRVAIESSLTLLRTIGALDSHGSITAEGRQLCQLGTHPLLGKLALSAKRHEFTTLAAALLALMEERDILGTSSGSADIALRLALLSSRSAQNTRVERAQKLSERWLSRIKGIGMQGKKPPYADTLTEDDQIALLLAEAFPLSIARRRTDDPHRYLLASGAGAALKAGDPLQSSEYLVVVEQKEASGDARIVLAARLHPALFEGPLQHLVNEETTVTFNEQRGALLASKQKRVGAVILTEQRNLPVDPDQEQAALIQFLSTGEGFSRIPFSENIQRLRARVLFARTSLSCQHFPDLCDTALRGSISEWLAPFLTAPYRLSSLTSALVSDAVMAQISYQQQKELATVAPEAFKLPSGKSRQLEYSSAHEVILAATIQELFGVRETPALGPAHFPVTIHLLSPARRPMQVTRDLAGFWRTGYQAVRKELRGRYPKHRWPEDPFDLD